MQDIVNGMERQSIESRKRINKTNPAGTERTEHPQNDSGTESEEEELAFLEEGSSSGNIVLNTSNTAEDDHSWDSVGKESGVLSNDEENTDDESEGLTAHSRKKSFSKEQCEFPLMTLSENIVDNQKHRTVAVVHPTAHDDPLRMVQDQWYLRPEPRPLKWFVPSSRLAVPPESYSLRPIGDKPAAVVEPPAPAMLPIGGLLALDGELVASPAAAGTIVSESRRRPRRLSLDLPTSRKSAFREPSGEEVRRKRRRLDRPSLDFDKMQQSRVLLDGPMTRARLRSSLSNEAE